MSTPFAAMTTIVSPAATPPAGTVSVSTLLLPLVTDPGPIDLTSVGPTYPAATTMPVGADVAESVPAAFVAVTTTRNVNPMSPTVTTSVADLVARLTQLAPATSQRCHT